MNIKEISLLLYLTLVIISLTSSYHITSHSKTLKVKNIFLMGFHYPLFKNPIPSQLCAVDNNLLSIIAGAAAGSIGVGVAYPLDSIKTKTQTFASNDANSGRSIGTINMIQMILKEEGISGFYGGVVWVMIGQAFIKSAAFASNTWALDHLSQNPETATLVDLIFAAFFAGFFTSFLVNPIERVKILMQSDNIKTYKSDLDCFVKVLQNDGAFGLVLRGIDATLWREIPGYALYFVTYSSLKASEFGIILGPVSTLVCGALAGSISWIPVFPIDVISNSYISLYLTHFYSIFIGY